MMTEPWLEDLRSEYARSLPAKISGLRDLATDLQARPGDQRLLSDLSHSVHRLTGSSGSYGFQAISRALAPWAALLAAACASQDRVPADQLAELRRCLDFVARSAKEH